jgi:hypothetical protein
VHLTRGEIARFIEKYVEGSKEECWEWNGSRYNNGYGTFYIRRGKRKTFLAHRIAWIVANGKDIPETQLVCHHCDNRACVNPHHLYVGTHYDNNSDTIIRCRGNRKTGLQCSWAKLSDSQVLEILLSKGKQKEVAKIYGIDPSTVSQIKSGKRRKNISRVEV